MMHLLQNYRGVLILSSLLRYPLCCGCSRSMKMCKYCGVCIRQHCDFLCLTSICINALTGNYDVIQQPKNAGEIARENVPFYMFVDEETEASLKNSSLLDSRNRVGLWRIILVRNVPYSDARRNGKVCSPSFPLNPSVHSL